MESHENKANTEEYGTEKQMEIDPRDRSLCEPLDPVTPEASYPLDFSVIKSKNSLFCLAQCSLIYH